MEPERFRLPQAMHSLRQMHKEGVFQAKVKAWPKAPGCEEIEKLQLFVEEVIVARDGSTHWCHPHA